MSRVAQLMAWKAIVESTDGKPTVEMTREVLGALVAAYEETIQVLGEVVNQACSTSDGQVDSCALSAYADGIRHLADLGLIEIEVDVLRRVVGRWAS